MLVELRTNDGVGLSFESRHPTSRCVREELVGPHALPDLFSDDDRQQPSPEPKQTAAGGPVSDDSDFDDESEKIPF